MTMTLRNFMNIQKRWEEILILTVICLLCMIILIECGVPREHLKNLPRDLLQLISSDYCGLCAVEFDTFALARVHYNSKNHLKNQKKWQLNRGHGGQGMGPLKSRDLYCELCDVEITSKVHSQSHYSGKAHRAIVEGRRNPKNPILVQPGMEDRVKQLVRREKRFLVSEDIDSAEAATSDLIDIKDRIPPELHCDICKTFVTCTEQMTLHLNGKKHLNKEKQHILKMMKGEASGNDEPAKSTANNDDDLLRTLDHVLEKLPPIEDEDLREDEAVEEEDGAGEDWEKSGEKWDEPETLCS
ncbi:zinc finger protein 346 [Pieris rapae]|uniref:zinc finger protein 346 n=1 Tax=Pieris rapae TaxID=64459 RepID=UPI001E27ABB1|nr:zinc finger protein 346 [Pieris rapae]